MFAGKTEGINVPLPTKLPDMAALFFLPLRETIFRSRKIIWSFTNKLFLFGYQFKF